MSNKSRQGIRPAFLVAVLGVVAMLAVLAALTSPSGPAHAQSSPFDPPAPTGVNAAANSDGTEVTVTWTAGTGGAPASGYEVERKVGSGDYMSVDSAHTGTLASYTDSSVSGGTTYTYRVRATNNFGQSVWVASNEVTVAAAVSPVPAMPGFMVRHGGEARQVSVSWDAVTDAHEYIVEYRTCPAEPCGGDFTMVTRPAADTMYLITNLNEGAQYQVRVTAENAAGTVLARSSSLVSTSRYLLTFANDGVTPLRGHAEDFMPTVTAGVTTTVRATVWVPTTRDADRTDTVTVQFRSADDTADPLKYHGIDVDDSDEFTTLGLLAVSGTGVGHGELTIRPRDADRRSFAMTFECTLPATKVDVVVYDDEVNVVERGSVTLKCPAPPAPPPPSGETADAECYSVTGMVDQGRDDLDLAANNPSRTVNSAVGARGIFRNADGTLDIRNRRAEIGQDTTEVLVKSANVQLIVTSCEPGPVYIRFLDKDMNAFGTDVDEEPAHRGADVVGLDSQGKLEMNIMTGALTAAQGLMYDRYSLVETARSSTSWVQYLSGTPGTYYQGKFRFFDPCPMVTDHFYVEVYEKYGKNIRELENGMHREKVTCVPPLQPGANELQVSFDTADVTDANTGTAVVTWEAIDDATVYTVAVINTTNAARYTIHGTPAMVNVAAGDPEANRVARFPGIVSGTRYIFAVYAQVTGGTYSALRSVILTPEFVAN